MPGIHVHGDALMMKKTKGGSQNFKLKITNKKYLTNARKLAVEVVGVSSENTVIIFILHHLNTALHIVAKMYIIVNCEKGLTYDLV